MYAPKDDFDRTNLYQAYLDLSGLDSSGDGYYESFERFLEIVKPIGPLHKGTHIFHQGDAFDELTIVRVGCVKSYSVSGKGNERVTEFCLPKDLVGLNDFYVRKHNVSAVALNTVMLYQLPIDHAEELIQGLSMRLLRSMSSNLQMSNDLFSLQTANHRVATFLNNFGARLGSSGFSGNHYVLPMSRQDIAGYLGLTQETVSRELTRLQNMGVIRLEHREVRILN